MLTKVIIIVVASILFPAFGIYLDWQHAKKLKAKKKMKEEESMPTESNL
jgi:hypothetical protein